MFISKWIIIIFLIAAAIMSIFFIYDNMVFNDTNNLKSTPTFLPDEIIEMLGSSKCSNLSSPFDAYSVQTCHNEYYELFNLKECNYSIKDDILANDAEEMNRKMGKCYREFDKLFTEGTDYYKEKVPILCPGLSDTNCLEKLKLELQK